MKNNIIIILLFALCFGFKAQAQSEKVLTVSEKLEQLNENEQGILQSLLYGTPPKLLFSDKGEAIYIWNEGKPVVTVDLDNQKQIYLLRNSSYAKDYANVTVLIIPVGEDTQQAILGSSDLQYFGKVAYLVLRYEKAVNINNIVSKIQQELAISPFSRIEILLEEVNRNEDGD